MALRRVSQSGLSPLRRAVGRFIEDDCPTLAASLAYYTLFAMPPLLFLLVMVVSLGMSLAYERSRADTQARALLEQQAAQMMGNTAAAREIGAIIENTSRKPGTWWKSAISLVGVLIGATGLVSALQSSLNRVWQVKVQSGSFVKNFLLKRLLSLAMILAFGFLLLVSFVASTIFNTFTTYVTQQFDWRDPLPALVNQLVSLLTTWIFFAAIFRFMPDAQVSWRHAFLGAVVTVVLFTVGRYALFAYLSLATPGAELGSAAGSLVIILLWVYYSSIILLFGAEYTAALSGGQAKPEAGAEYART